MCLLFVTIKNLDSLSWTFSLMVRNKKCSLMIKKIFFWNQFQLHLGRTVYPKANIPGGPGVRPTGADQ